MSHERITPISDTELNAKMEQYGYKLTNTFQVKEGYIHRKVAGNDVLVSIGGNVANFNGYIELNSSAACLWDQMKEPCSCQKLIQALETTFGISQAQAMEDVLDFVKKLQEHDMVKII